MAPLVIPEELLLEKTTDSVEEIRKLIKARILENKKKFPKWKTDKTLLRTGLPKPFLFGGKIVSISGANEFG